MLGIYTLKIPENLHSEEHEFLTKLLQKNSEFRIKKMLNTKDQYLSLFGELLSKLILCEYYNCSIQEINFEISKYGKPYINNDIFFNISHSENFLIFGFSKKMIGIDVEHINSEEDLSEYNIFNQKEQQYLTSPIDYYLQWTLKESWLKCIGVGLLINPQEFSILNINARYTLEIDDRVNIETDLKLEILPYEFQFSTIKIDNFIISVCIKDSISRKIDLSKSIIEIEVDDLLKRIKNSLLKYD